MDDPDYGLSLFLTRITNESMLHIQNLSYAHPNKDVLFNELNLIVNAGEKIALIGHNGVGKSSLLQLIAGTLKATDGVLKADQPAFYIPQVFGQYNLLTVAEALRVDKKIRALHAILAGSISEVDFTLLAEDWTIEERCQDALQQWDLPEINLDQKMESLSGGQKTKVFLAGMSIHQPAFVLLDEPTNHLDVSGRSLLYHFIKSTIDFNCRQSRPNIITSFKHSMRIEQQRDQNIWG